MSNDFIPFAVGGSANVTPQATYAANTTLTQGGFQSGLAKSPDLNKVWRQSSIVSAVLAQFIVDQSGQSAVDDGTTATLEANLLAAIRNAAKQTVILTDTGAANAYAAANAPALTALPSTGYVQRVNIAHANTGASTYAPDGLATKPIYGLGLQPLQGGELPVGVAVFMYLVQAGVNGGNGAWVIVEALGGAQQVSPATQSQHAVQLGQTFQSLAMAVAGNALTGTLVAPTGLPFRNPTLSNGAPVFGTIPSNLSLTVPSGATLGTANGVSARLVWLIAYNGGTPALCVTNLAGGMNLDETTLINATAISGAANSASTIYSTTAITNSPFRVIGFCDITEAAGGTWATGPTTVQGIGGEAIASLGSLGYGQTLQTFTGGTRAVGTTYVNSTGRPIFVMASVTATTTGVVSAQLNAIQVGALNVASGAFGGFQWLVPPGSTYGIAPSTGAFTVNQWGEIR